MDGGEKVGPGIRFLFTADCTYGNRLPVFKSMPGWLPGEKAITCLSWPAQGAETGWMLTGRLPSSIIHPIVSFCLLS